MKLRTGLDMFGNEIRLAVAERVAELPNTNLFAGRTVLVITPGTDPDPDTGKYYYYNGESWVALEAPDIPTVNTFPGYAYYDPSDDDTKQITKWSEPDVTPSATDTKATDEHEHKDDFVTASQVANTLKNLRRFENPSIDDSVEHHGIPYYDANGQLQSLDTTQKYTELQSIAPTGRAMVPKIATGGNINQYPFLIDGPHYTLTPASTWEDVIPTSGCVLNNIQNMASYILGEINPGIGLITTNTSGETTWTEVSVASGETDLLTATSTGFGTIEVVTRIDKSSTNNEIPTAKAVQDKIQAEMTDDVDDISTVSGKGVKDYVDKIADSITASMTNDVSDAGDVPILGFNNECTIYYSLTNGGITPETQTNPETTGYTDNLAGGYILTGPADVYRNKVFNRIKVFVMRPGIVRIGIVRGTGKDCKDRIARGCFKANPRYDDIDDYPLTLLDTEEAIDTTCDGQSHTLLKKWLVTKFCAYNGVQVFDFPDEIITSPHEYIFIECRNGTIGYIKNNTGAAITTNYGSVPNGTCHTGVAMNTDFVTWSDLQSGKFFLSKDILCDSACFSHGIVTTLNGTGFGQGFLSMTYNREDINEYIDNNYQGMLNIGIYKRGTSSDRYFSPLAEESCTKWDFTSDSLKSRIVAGYAPGGYEAQQKLAKAGLSIYAFEIILAVPGDLSVFVFSSNDPATCKVVKHWTFRLRAIGKQFVHLPEDVILKEGEWIGFGGCTEALLKAAPDDNTCFESAGVLKAGYYDFAIPVYRPGRTNTFDNWTCFGDNAITGRHQNEGDYSSAIEDFTHGFCYWKGVKYVGTTSSSRGHLDFTNAEFIDNSSDNSNINLCVCLHTRSGKISKLEDLWCSVTGDSITTYRNVIPHTDDFASNNNAAGDYAICYPDAGSGLVNSPDNTWWGTLIKQTRMRFLINEAWSGSRVSGTDSATSSTACASLIRTKKLHNKITSYALNSSKKLGHPHAYPDIIFCMIGTNDIAGNVATGAYSNNNITSMDTILGAFETMVYRHKINYPHAKRIYFIIPRGTASYPYQNSNAFSISQFADSAEYICKAFGSYFVPLSYFGALDAGYTYSTNQCVWIPNGNWYRCPTGVEGGSPRDNCDHLHPAPVGNQIIANGLQRFVENIL